MTSFAIFGRNLRRVVDSCLWGTFRSDYDFWAREAWVLAVVDTVVRDFKIRDYRRLDARSPMSGGLDRVRSVVACCGAKTQIKLLHYQLRTTRNCSSRIHFEDVFPKSQRWAYLLFRWWNSRWGRVCFALRCLQVDKFYLSVLGVRRIFAWPAEFRWVSCRF